MLMKDVLQLDVFKNSQILAGQKGLDNEVNRVTVMEATSEESFRWYKGGELVLTCFYAISDDIDQQIKIFRFLNSQKVAGVVIFSVGYFLPEVSTMLIAESNAIGLPLVVMPSEATYEEVLSALMSTLLGIRNNDLLLALRVQRTMNLMVLRKENIQALMRFLMDVLRKKIVLMDNENHQIYSDGITEAIPQDFYQIPEGDDSPIMMYKEHCLRYAVVAHNYYYGSIVVLDVGNTEVERLQIVLSNTVLPLTLTNMRKTSMLAKSELEINNFFTNLMEGRFKDVSEMLEQAEQIRINLYDHHVVIVIQIENTPGKEYLKEVKHISLLDHKQNKVFSFNNSLILLPYSETDQNPDKRIIKLCRATQRLFEKRIIAHIGISNFYKTVDEMESAYRQALQAIKIGMWFHRDNSSPERIYFYGELGVFSILYKYYVPSRDGIGICRDMLRLQKYDNLHGSQYAETLKTLLLSNESTETIASMMNIHKNTLFYRRNKIIQLLGHDPFSMPLKFNYQAYFIAENLLSLK
jgi:purine catabolism regulator